MQLVSQLQLAALAAPTPRRVRGAGSVKLFSHCLVGCSWQFAALAAPTPKMGEGRGWFS